MTTLSLSTLFAAALLYALWQRRGRKRAERAAEYNLRRMRHCRRQYFKLLKAHTSNEAIFRQMRRVTSQPEN